MLFHEKKILTCKIISIYTSNTDQDRLFETIGFDDL